VQERIASAHSVRATQKYNIKEMRLSNQLENETQHPAKLKFKKNVENGPFASVRPISNSIINVIQFSFSMNCCFRQIISSLEPSLKPKRFPIVTWPAGVSKTGINNADPGSVGEARVQVCK